MFKITAITLKQIRAEKFVVTPIGHEYKDFNRLVQQLETDTAALDDVKSFAEDGSIIGRDFHSFEEVEKVIYATFKNKCTSRKINRSHYAISTHYATIHIEKINR